MYKVKEIFYTLQGEGAHSGRAAVFCRFVGCNLWSGYEKDRARSLCRFCDTDFLDDSIGSYDYIQEDLLASVISAYWPNSISGDAGTPYVVFTGGEPLLQLDTALLHALHARGFFVAVETNGTQPVLPGLDWICVSPKAGAQLIITSGDELKLVFPQEDLNPNEFTKLEFQHFFIQPMDGPNLESNITAAIRYCLNHPQWRLSLQAQKFLGLP